VRFGHKVEESRGLGREGFSGERRGNTKFEGGCELVILVREDGSAW
jgi:hypothetical protein